MFVKRVFRRNQTLISVVSSFTFSRRHYCSPLPPPSNLKQYGFKPPPSLHPLNPNPRRVGQSKDEVTKTKKKQKPLYRPPSSLDRTGQKPVHSDLAFDFRFSYTESSPSVKPIGLREPKYSPFGPGRIDRVWTGVTAPSVDPTVRSVDEDGQGKRGRKVRTKTREEILGAPLSPAERRILVEKCQKHKTKRQVNLGRDGLTHNMLNDIHNNWKHAEAVRIKCLGVPTVDMKNVCTQLEEKTGGQIIHRQGGQIVLHRGRHYNPKKRPVVPLMLWKPHDPIYPRLIKTVIDGLTIEGTKEMRKRGLTVPVLTRLAKNGFYGSLVPMVRDAFLTDELVRIDCKGLEKSDYRKIGLKLRDLVPCVLVTFDKEQIVVWRGKNYNSTKLQNSEFKSFGTDTQSDSGSENISGTISQQSFENDSDCCSQRFRSRKL